MTASNTLKTLLAGLATVAVVGTAMAQAHHPPPQAPTLPRAPASKARKARRWAPRALAVGAPRRRPRKPLQHLPLQPP